MERTFYFGNLAFHESGKDPKLRFHPAETRDILLGGFDTAQHLIDAII